VLGRRWFPGGGELPQANIHAPGRGCVPKGVLCVFTRNIVFPLRRWLHGGGGLPQAKIHAPGGGCVSGLFLKELYVFSQETWSSFEEGSIVFLGAAMGMWMMLECIGGSQEMGWEKVREKEG